MKKNFYGVRKGRKTGVFKNWDECKESVNGFPNAEYKGFATEKEARAYVGETVQKSVQKAYSARKYVNPAKHESVHKTAPARKPETASGSVQKPQQRKLVAYTDGSYDEVLGRWGFGCVFLTPEGKVIKKSGSGAEYSVIRNVAGELRAVMFAADWAKKHGYDALEIRYDYSGVKNWITGEWTAKHPAAQEYISHMQNCNLDLSFRKIARHSGNRYNEMADQLAKAALNPSGGYAEELKSKFAENDNLAVRLDSGYFVIHETEEGFDYTYYDEDFRDIDGGIESCLEDAIAELLRNHSVTGYADYDIVEELAFDTWKERVKESL